MTCKLFAPLLILAAACASSSSSKRESPKPPVTIHPNIRQAIHLAGFEQRRTEDGRLAIKMILSNRGTKDRPVIVTADWLDTKGSHLERSTPRKVLVPRGGTYIYEDAAFSAEAVRCEIAVR